MQCDSAAQQSRTQGGGNWDRWVGADDDRYFDPRYFARPRDGQTWFDARVEQVEAINAREASWRTSRRKSKGNDRSAVRQCPSQIIRAAGGLQNAFPELIPARPYCVDSLKQGEGLFREPKGVALTKRHLQFNRAASFTWMLHDYDRTGSTGAHRAAGLPPPNVIVINPENDHSHSAYLLALPVARHAASRIGPLRYYAAVERGIARRLGADPHYTGLIAKNPLHTDWRVEWRRDEPYALSDLSATLSQHHMRFDPTPKHQTGAGRNVTVFDDLRRFAYREVLRFKHRGLDLDAFRARLEDVALGINRQFPSGLPLSEIRATVRSVAKWTWRHFSDDGFRARQTVLARRGAAKRWEGHVAATRTKPWEAEGMSRSTWYRRQACAKPSARL